MALCAWGLTMGQQNVFVYFLADHTFCENTYLRRFNKVEKSPQNSSNNSHP